MIDPITPAKLKENLAHKEIRILHQKNSPDYLLRYSWDKRVILANSGGSHHFSAARYIARKLDKTVFITGRLEEYSLIFSQIRNLLLKYSIYVVKIAPAEQADFQNSLGAIKDQNILYALPGGYEDSYALLLSKDSRKCRFVSRALKQLSYFDLGEYLLSLASN